ncbi:hypothetical protein N0V93_009469 [Gnomoniopsis smithogilvyi]|uniref:Uncharacterized protein n=1 Tax=Gnomoniopsis smithogilvyi TaxID=1191159 RepID=A0A9W8YKJ7_9PEZI|nr:hypothetical protein N0V93_009469 [Gnomoniopsis smithogilvyi]
MTSNYPIPSQTSSHAPLEPISGITLLHAELNRRANLRPACSTGCCELDNVTFISGGFERGCVVGISAEEDDVALVLGLQTIARLLTGAGGGKRKSRAMIISTVGVGSLVGILREVLRAQGVRERETETEVLGRVAVSRVFDMNGLWEVLGELDALGGSQEVGEGTRTPQAAQDGKESLRDGGEDALRFVATPAGEDDESHGLKSPAAVHTEARALGDDGEESGHILHAGAPSSSPLSDPPSSLPDIALWESAEDAVLDANSARTAGTTDQGDVDWPRKTPPGQREEIQDSEEEEGFSSPLVPSQGSVEASPVKLPAPRASLPIERNDLDSDQADTTSPSIEPPYERDDREPSPTAAEAAGIRGKDQEYMPSRPPKTSSAEDNSDGPREKAQAFKAVDGEKTPPAPSSYKGESTHPDIILITHMSTLLSSLFHQREKATAHQTLQLLASHLRYLARSTEHGGPLIMILNSTTTSESNVAAPAQHHDRDGPPLPPPSGGPSTPNKPLDPTLRSIFNPPPLPVSGLPYHYDTPHSRRNKPSFGLIFTQLLDLHLLCTKIPRTRADAEALYAPTSPGTRKAVEYVWAVEVLLDGIGVWEGREHVLEGRPRRFRDQRWGAVEVKRDVMGLRIVDAFEKTAQAVPQQIVLAAGFGGPRV